MLFGHIGPLKRCGIHWDPLGKSKGTAHIQYEKAEDAAKAISEYNGADLDGNKLVVEYKKKMAPTERKRSAEKPLPGFT